jgi:hypothetical protein
MEEGHIYAELITKLKHIVTCPGFAWLIRRILNLMIEFIGSLYNWLQQFANHYLTHSHLPTGHSTGTILTSNWTEPAIQSQIQSHIATDGQSVSQSWCRAYYCLTVTVLFLSGALSNERTGLSFVYAAGPCQRSLSRVWVPWYSRPYFTVSDSRLPFSSPLATRRVTVEVFDPASTRVSQNCQLLLASQYIASGRTTPKKTHPLPSNGYMRTHIENTSCNTGSIIACMYCGRCLEMCLLYCWLRICCGIVYRDVP